MAGLFWKCKIVAVYSHELNRVTATPSPCTGPRLIWTYAQLRFQKYNHRIVKQFIEELWRKVLEEQRKQENNNFCQDN